MNKHGVLTNMYLAYHDGKEMQYKGVLPDEGGDTLEDLCAIAMSQGLTHLWVMPDTLIVPDEQYAQFDENVWYLNVHMVGKNEKKRIRTVSGWKQGGGNPNIVIVFLENTMWYLDHGRPGIWHDLTYYALLNTIAQLEETLHVSVAGSPQTIGWKLIRMFHPEWINDTPKVNLRECHLDGRAARDIVWQATPLVVKKRYVHKVDRRSAYSYAASFDCFMGTGTPVHVFHGQDYYEKKVGVWRVEVVSGPAPEYADIPPIWEKREGWLCAPMIKALLSAGYVLTFHEGWVFPQKHAILEKWANFLWKAREKLTGPARDAIKIIMNSTVGSMGSRNIAAIEEEIDKKRPDMRMQVIGRHTELMWHTIHKGKKLYGLLPSIVYMDALYYQLDTPDFRGTLPELVKREKEFGGMKYEGYIDLEEEFSYTFKGENAPAPFSGKLATALENTRYSEAHKLEILNAKGWVI